MSSERGSTTIMAIAAMLILAAGSASYAYVANRNVNIATEYVDGLQAQYSAEAAVKIFYVAGKESHNKDNGYDEAKKTNLALEDWRLQTDQSTTKTLPIKLPGNKMGNADVKVTYSINSTTKYNVQARSTVNKAHRTASNKGIDLINSDEITDVTYSGSTAALIDSGNKLIQKVDSNGKLVSSDLKWQLPDDLNSKTSPAKSPGSGTSAWSSVYSRVLFNDTLGFGKLTPTGNLQLVFRVNYYIKLTNASASGGSGYGIYYLAQKNPDLKNAGDPSKAIAYIMQCDPGVTDWGASTSSTSTGWPYGAFLVKKVNGANSAGAQNEVWDESGGYDGNYAFQDNNELMQHYYKKQTNGSYSIPTLNLNDSRTWALQPVSNVPSTKKPNMVPSKTNEPNVPTVFGTDLTGNYHSRPPDLRIAYTLGNIAEGNPWQANTYYPVGAKVAVGVWADDPIKKRMVWVATTAGLSSTSKPSVLSQMPSNGANVTEEVMEGSVNKGVTWTAQLAPTPEQVANFFKNNSQLSIAKISMADLKIRVDNVNGTAPHTDPYDNPLTIISASIHSKNKITIELWADNKGNRIHIIRVNDVLALGFNDMSGTTKTNIIPANWELDPISDPRSTGLKIWHAAAEFYASDSYGQTMTTTTNSNYGTWGK